jgi:hypothetical protein
VYLLGKGALDAGMGALMALLIVTASAGVFFGVFYNFWVLLPLTVAVAIVCCLTTLLSGQESSAALFALLISPVGLQTGYLLGLASRDVFKKCVARLDGARRARLFEDL